MVKKKINEMGKKKVYLGNATFARECNIKKLFFCERVQMFHVERLGFLRKCKNFAMERKVSLGNANIY